MELFGEIVKDEPKTKAAEYVLRFQRCYELATKQPFEYKREHFVIAARLIKKHGYEALVKKTMIFAQMCNRRSSWFTQNGWADFTIGQLSNKWNSIIPSQIETPEEKKKNDFYEKMKAREMRVV